MFRSNGVKAAVKFQQALSLAADIDVQQKHASPVECCDATLWSPGKKAQPPLPQGGVGGKGGGGKILL